MFSYINKSKIQDILVNAIENLLYFFAHGVMANDRVAVIRNACNEKPEFNLFPEYRADLACKHTKTDSTYTLHMSFFQTWLHTIDNGLVPYVTVCHENSSQIDSDGVLPIIFFSCHYLDRVLFQMNRKKYVPYMFSQWPNIDSAGN